MEEAKHPLQVIATLIEMCHSSCHPIPLSSSLTCLDRQRMTKSLMFQGIPWWRRFWDLGYQFRFGPELLPVSVAEWSRRWVHSVDTIANLEYLVYKVQLYGQSVPGSIPGQNISEKWKRQNILCKYCNTNSWLGFYVLCDQQEFQLGYKLYLKPGVNVKQDCITAKDPCPPPFSVPKRNKKLVVWRRRRRRKSPSVDPCYCKGCG